MTFSIAFTNKALMNEVIGRCNISKYNISNAVYKDNTKILRQCIYLIISEPDTLDALLSILQEQDDVTVALQRDPKSYTCAPTQIWLNNNSTPIETNMMILSKSI